MFTLPPDYTTIFELFQPVLYQPNLVASRTVADWSDLGFRAANGKRDPAGPGIEQGQAFPDLSSGVEPGGMDEPGPQPGSADFRNDL